MTCYVIPASLDQGSLGQRIEANTPEEAASIAASTSLAAHAHEPMVVRWQVKFNAKGDITFSRLMEVPPSGKAPAAEPKPAPAAAAPPAAAPAPAAPAAPAAPTATAAPAPASAPTDAPKA